MLSPPLVCVSGVWTLWGHSWADGGMERWTGGRCCTLICTELQGRAVHINEPAQPVPTPQHPRSSRWDLGQGRLEPRGSQGLAGRQASAQCTPIPTRLSSLAGPPSVQGHWMPEDSEGG